MKKIIALLLALIMIASAVAMTACEGKTNETEAPTETPTEAPTEAETDAPVVDDNPYPVNELTVAGTPIAEFVIVRNPNGGQAITYAATELQEYIETSCGVKLEIVDTASAGTKRLLLDETKTDYDTDDFKYYSDADGIVFEGSAKRGIIYAIYNFLENQIGWRFFAEDCEVCYESDKIDLVNVSQDYHFLYKIRDIYANSYFPYDISLKRYQNGQGKRDGIIGGNDGFHDYGIHTLGSLAGVDGSTQPCLNDEETYQRILTNAKNWLMETGIKGIHVSQNDNQRYCTCEKCQADIDYYGSPAGSIIKLCNRLDEDFKAAGLEDIRVQTFAYQYSFPCPKNIKCNDDVAIELCTITYCVNHAYNDPNCEVNSACKKEIDAWAEICDEFYIWDYAINFKYFLCPWPNFDNILPNIQTLADIGAVGIISQANYQGNNKSGEFEALRCYLVAKALEDPYMTEAEYYTHMDEFLKAYYGEGWVYVRNFIDFILELSSQNEACHDLWASPETVYGDHAFEQYNELLIEWWDKAEELAANDPVQLEHVRRSRLCCDYLRIGAIHHQAYDARDAMRQVVRDYYNELKELGVTRIAENFPIPERVNVDWNPRNWWSMHYYEE